jgi:outer membrane lipoprotein SlyB
MKRKLTILAVALAVLASGCATAPNGDVGMTPQGKQALGAVVGAGVGGYFGSKVGGGGKNTAGTVAGTILGGAIGGVLSAPPVQSGYYGPAPAPSNVTSSGYSYPPSNGSPY